MDYIKSQNTYFAEPKDDPKDRIQVEIGDSKQPDFYPQVKLMRWDNEVNFSVRLKTTETASSLKTGEKIEWDTPKMKVNFYALEEGEGGYEFEVILKEKPLNNKIEFTLEDKDVEYFYQPELTQKEIDDGAVRPENVVGSYAVYAKTPKTNWTGGKEYKVGKVGHIYRPKIIDSAGTEVWGDLHIADGILSVTIPQDFLDKAVYPVRHAAGLTFGYEGTPSTYSHANANIAWFTKGTPGGGNGSVDSISFYGSTAGSPHQSNVKGFITNFASPRALLTNGVTPATLCTFASDGTKAWKTLTYSTKPSVTNAADYFICIIFESDFKIQVYYDSSAGNGGYDTTNSYTTPAGIGTTLDDSTSRHAIYATYTPDEGSPSNTPSSSPSEGTPSGSPSQGTPSGSPSQGTPSGSPSEGTPSSSPSEGTPSGSPSEGTPSGSPSEGTPSNTPSHSPSSSPSEGTPSNTPSGSPSEGTPSNTPSHSPSSSPSEGTPSGSPSQGTPSGSPSEGTPSGSPSEGTPSGSPSEGTPSGSPSQGTPSGSPSEGTPSSSPSQGTPSGSPSQGTPSGSPSEGTPSGSPSEGTPSGSPSEGTPSGSPSEGTPSASPSEGTPSNTPSGSPSEGTPSGDDAYYSLNRNKFIETGELAFQYRPLRISTWGTSARPANPKEGDIGLNTVTNDLEVWDGSAWIVNEYSNSYIIGDGVNKITVGASEPSSPQTGDLWVDTT